MTDSCPLPQPGEAERRAAEAMGVGEVGPERSGVGGAGEWSEWGVGGGGLDQSGVGGEVGVFGVESGGRGVGVFGVRWGRSWSG